jgi:putative nucleotidyltransferase with HDIG domain
MFSSFAGVVTMSLCASYLEKILVEIDTLPPVSEVFHKILELTGGDDASRDELVRCVSLDPAISAKILQTINSAYFGVSEKVSSLKVAVGLLGDVNIRDIAIMCAASGVLRKSIMGYGIMAEEFWFHSVTAAFASRQISEKIGGEDHDLAFSAGLLHDIGKLAIDRVIRETQKDMSWDTKKDFMPHYHEMEADAYGFDHCTAGFFLARSWSLPDKLTSAIAFHHATDLEGQDNELIHIVNFADILAHFMSMKIINSDFIMLLLEENQIPFEFSPRDIEDIYAKLRIEMEYSEALLKM